MLHENELWIFDTVATTHFCKNLFETFKPRNDKNIHGTTCPIEGKGKIDLVFYNESKRCEITLSNIINSLCL